MFQEDHVPSQEEMQSTAKTILIVDDDADIGEYLEAAIQQETPYHTVLVVDSEEAVEAVKQLKPHLLLLDYHLSTMNGIELYDHLHATVGLEAIPAIIMSASLPLQRLEDQIHERNIIALPNPHNVSDLLRTLGALLA